MYTKKVIEIFHILYIHALLNSRQVGNTFKSAAKGFSCLPLYLEETRSPSYVQRRYTNCSVTLNSRPCRMSLISHVV